MGKVTKRKEGRISEVEFKGDRTVIVRVRNEVIQVVEKGLFESEIRTICQKDIRLYEEVARILETSRTLEDAIPHLNNLYLEGQRRTIHEKQVAEHEELASALTHYELYRKPLQKWEYFQAQVQKRYVEKQKHPSDPERIKAAVLETLEAYLDPQHPDHVKAVNFLIEVPFSDPLRHEEDGLWILRDMIVWAALSTAEPQEYYHEFRLAVRGLKLSLGSRYYDPVPYLNDVDTALDWLDAAQKSMDQGDWEVAIGFCLKAIEAAPNYLEAYYRTAECYIMQNNYESAIGALDSVLHMPAPEKIFKHRQDYYTLYFGLCIKMPDKGRAQICIGKLKELAEKYGVTVPGIITDQDNS